MLGNKYQQMIQNARSQLASKQGHQHAQGNPSCGCGVPQARLPSSQNPDSGGGWQWQAGPSPLGPGAQATQYSSGPSPISPVPVATFMPPGDIQMVQAGASVAAQACCVSALAPPYLHDPALRAGPVRALHIEDDLLQQPLRRHDIHVGQVQLG